MSQHSVLAPLADRHDAGPGQVAVRAASPYSAARVCAVLAVLVLIAGWSSLFTATVDFGSLCGLRWPEPLTTQILDAGHLALSVSALLWLGYLVIGRTPRRTGHLLRRMAVRGAAVTVGGASSQRRYPPAACSRHRP